MKPSEQIDQTAFQKYREIKDQRTARWIALMDYLDRLHAEREAEKKDRHEVLTLLTRQHLIPAAHRRYQEKEDLREKVLDTISDLAGKSETDFDRWLKDNPEELERLQQAATSCATNLVAWVNEASKQPWFQEAEARIVESTK